MLNRGSTMYLNTSITKTPFKVYHTAEKLITDLLLFLLQEDGKLLMKEDH